MSSRWMAFKAPHVEVTSALSGAGWRWVWLRIAASSRSPLRSRSSVANVISLRLSSANEVLEVRPERSGTWLHHLTRVAEDTASGLL